MKLEIIECLSQDVSFSIPLIFVHGAYHGAWSWEENFLSFFEQKGFSCYAVSLRGHGKSEGHDDINTFSMDDYIKDVMSLIEKQDKRPILIGHSMGGAIVQIIAKEYSDMISGIVLLASIPPSGMLKALLRIIFTEWKIARELLYFNKNRNCYVVGALFFSKSLPKESFIKYCQRLDCESKLASRESLGRMVKKDVISHKLPVLVIGSKKDKMIPLKQLKAMGKFYKQEVYILENSGHDVMLDTEWEEAANKIMSFLEENFRQEYIKNRGD